MVQNIHLDDIIISTAEAGLELMTDSGHMPAGNNGPWDDDETPVRNTAHWGIIFSYAAERTEKSKFLNAGHKCASYLMSDESRPYNQTFYNRKDNNIDKCNGLIGQAWAIEGLVQIGKMLEDDDLLYLAERVFQLHPFNDLLSGWHTVDVTGKNIGYNFTLNQQVWFAAVGGELSEICDNNIINKQIVNFIDRLPQMIRSYQNGPIYHSVALGNILNRRVDYLVENIRQKRIPDEVLQLFRREYDSKLEKWSVGYHSFILYGLARLHKLFPSHDVWQTETIKQIKNYTKSGRYLNATFNNEFCYSYNCTGFEVALWETEFNTEPNNTTEWITRQLNQTYNLQTGIFNKSPYDKRTLAARMYEAIRLPNVKLEFSSNKIY